MLGETCRAAYERAHQLQTAPQSRGNTRDRPARASRKSVLAEVRGSAAAARTLASADAQPRCRSRLSRLTGLSPPETVKAAPTSTSISRAGARGAGPI